MKLGLRNGSYSLQIFYEKSIIRIVSLIGRRNGFKICRSLSELYRDNKVNVITGSLMGASNILQKYSGNFEIEPPDNSLFSSTLIEEKTDWGPGLSIRCPSTIDGRYANWKIAPGPLGQDIPSF